jgi:hypothetical protein
MRSRLCAFDRGEGGTDLRIKARLSKVGVVIVVDTDHDPGPAGGVVPGCA